MVSQIIFELKLQIYAICLCIVGGEEAGIFCVNGMPREISRNLLIKIKLNTSYRESTVLVDELSLSHNH